MGWLITLGILTLLAILPLGVSVKYNAEGPRVRVILGPIKFTVFPLPKKAMASRRLVLPWALSPTIRFTPGSNASSKLT